MKVFEADVAKPMPFLQTESYDYIICSLLLHYIKDWDPPLAELYRVMKNGGKIFISTHHPFAMYLYVKPESYYDFKLVEDTWGIYEGTPFQVHYYIRPLGEILQPMLKSKFTICNIEEMTPHKGLKETHPDIYQRMTERPGFLYIALEKQAD